MTNTTSTVDDRDACEVCASIPARLWVNTSCGESLHPKLDQLVRLDLDSTNDLYACPNCEALFEWADLTQHYGPGNNDEERLTKLSVNQASIARALLDPDPGDRDHEHLLELAFEMLSHEIVYNALSYRAHRTKKAFSGFVRPLVRRLAVQNNGWLVSVLRSYCDTDQGRLREMVQLLDAEGPNISKSAQYFRQTCAGQLETGR